MPTHLGTVTTTSYLEGLRGITRRVFSGRSGVEDPAAYGLGAVHHYVI